MIVAVPPEIPLTSPVEAFTVATAGLLLLQLPPPTDELNDEELPAQMVWVPLRTPAMGAAVTVIVRDAVASAHPPVPETV